MSQIARNSRKVEKNKVTLCGVQFSCNQFGNPRTSTFKFLSRTACLKKQDAGMHTRNAKPAERPSVSKAKVKRDTTAIITSHCQSKPNKFNMQGRWVLAETHQAKTLDKRKKGDRSLGKTLDRRREILYKLL